MKIRFHSPVLIARDLDGLKKFYGDVLNQEIEFDFGPCVSFKCGLSIWQLRPENPIAGHLKYTYSPQGNKNLELCFETDDFDPVVREIKKHDLRLLHDVVEESWGQRTIRVFDPEDNLVEIGESMPCFVRRLATQGLSEMEIAEKTSIPVETVKGYLDGLL